MIRSLQPSFTASCGKQRVLGRSPNPAVLLQPSLLLRRTTPWWASCTLRLMFSSCCRDAGSSCCLWLGSLGKMLTCVRKTERWATVCPAPHTSGRAVTGIAAVHPAGILCRAGRSCVVWILLNIKRKNIMTTVALVVIPGMCKLTETNASQSSLIN